MTTDSSAVLSATKECRVGPPPPFFERPMLKEGSIKTGLQQQESVKHSLSSGRQMRRAVTSGKNDRNNQAVGAGRVALLC
jgi:hypothetical protein